MTATPSIELPTWMVEQLSQASPFPVPGHLQRVDRKHHISPDRRLGGALFLQAFSALRASPGARSFWDRQRAHGQPTTKPSEPSPTARRHPARLPAAPNPLRRDRAWHTNYNEINLVASPMPVVGCRVRDPQPRRLGSR
jgi:hypothetical protein